MSHSKFIPTLCWLALGLLLPGFHCGESAGIAPQGTAARQSAKPTLRILLLTDPLGYLEPCGCQQRPLGGIDKLASRVRLLRGDGLPTLVMATGDLTFGKTVDADDVQGARTEELWRAETLIDAYGKLGLTAATPGSLDFSHGLDTQRALAKRARFPLLAENVSLPDGPLDSVEGARLFDAGGTQVGVFGVLAQHPALTAARVDADVRGIAQRAVTALRAKGAKLVIALTSGDRRVAREVANAGPDFVVMGGLDVDEPIAPQKQGDSTLLHAGRQGQRVLTLELSLAGSGPFRDASEWTFQAVRADLVKREKDLEARIRAWENDPQTLAADVASQRARLAILKTEVTTVKAPVREGRWFAASIMELAPEVPGDPELSALMDDIDKRVNAHNRQALQGRLPKPALPGSPSYVGSEGCKNCHTLAYDWWRGTKHGRAYATLETLDKQFSLACVSCHVTGYNEPGGSTVTHNAGLTNVGCESCHGPASLHGLEPNKPGLIIRDTPETICKACHNQEHSARFQYDAFRSLLRVPGHGLPAVKASNPKGAK